MRTPGRGFLRGAGIGLTLIAALSGCGSSSAINLDKTALERAIADSILKERHIHSLVSCPTERQKQGVTFTCEAMLTVGKYPIRVTETNDEGHVSYSNPAPLIALDTPRVASAITATLAKRNLKAHVTCPSNVLQQKGVVFMCTALVGNKAYPFEVTEVDRTGHVKFLGR